MAHRMSWSSTVEAEPVENALHSVKLIIQDILDNLHAGSEFQIYMSPPECFRNELYPEYKANRKKQPKPVHKDACAEYLRQYWHAATGSMWEADDAIGMANNPKRGTVVCTIDKDMKQLPGYHYNFVTKQKFYVTEEEALRFLWEQVMSGDPTDNVPGLPGIGPAKAKKYLGELSPHALESTVAEYYTTRYGEAEGAYQCKLNYALVKILQSPEELTYVQECVKNARNASEAAARSSDGAAGDTEGS